MKMEYLEQRPIGPLARYLEALWWIRAPRGEPAGPPERVLPDGCVELVLHLGDRFRAGRDPSHLAEQPRAVIERRFRAVVGLSPKGLARVLRFQAVFQALGRSTMPHAFVLALAVLAATGPREGRAPAAAASADPAVQLASLAWMVGGWASEEGGSSSEEHWLAARGGTMLGVNRQVAAGRTASFEFLRIEARPDGLVYLASPGGAAPTTFRAIEVSADRVVFENPAHDFPQRILYWRGKEALHARIEGTRDGRVRGREWRWPAAPAYGRDK